MPNRSPSTAAAQLSNALWFPINVAQAIFTLSWSAFWILAALAVRAVCRDAVPSLKMARRFWAPGLVWGGRMRFEVEGLEKVDFSHPCLFVANHQSIVDILALYYVLPVPLVFVLKEELRRVPFLGWYTAAMGMLFVRRESRAQSLEALRRSGEVVTGGQSILTFPEGTRSRDGTLGPFKPGAFLPAVDFAIPVVPVALSGPEKIIPPGTFRVRPGTIRVAFGEPIPTGGLRRADRRDLAEQARAQVLALRRRLAGS